GGRERRRVVGLCHAYAVRSVLRNASHVVSGVLPVARGRAHGEHAMRRSRITTILVCAVVAVVAFFGGAVYWLVRSNGFSARTLPTPIERLVTGALHRWSVPARARDAVNPVAF